MAIHEHTRSQCSFGTIFCRGFYLEVELPLPITYRRSVDCTSEETVQSVIDAGSVSVEELNGKVIPDVLDIVAGVDCRMPFQVMIERDFYRQSWQVEPRVASLLIGICFRVTRRVLNRYRKGFTKFHDLTRRSNIESHSRVGIIVINRTVEDVATKHRVFSVSGIASNRVFRVSVPIIGKDHHQRAVYDVIYLLLYPQARRVTSFDSTAGETVHPPLQDRYVRSLFRTIIYRNVPRPNFHMARLIGYTKLDKIVSWRVVGDITRRDRG